jgi:hypothetical protein
MYLIKTPQDIERAQGILAEAFNDSEGVNWVLKRKSKKAKALTVKVLLHEAIDKRGAYLSEDKNGAVLFYDANSKGTSLTNLFRKLYLILNYAGFRSAFRLISYRKMISSIRPKNSIVGFLVATDSSVKSNKAIYEIHNEMLSISQKQGKQIALETTKPRVRKLYSFAGYEEYAEVKHPYSDLTIWFFTKRN